MNKHTTSPSVLATISKLIERMNKIEAEMQLLENNPEHKDCLVLQKNELSASIQRLRMWLNLNRNSS